MSVTDAEVKAPQSDGTEPHLRPHARAVGSCRFCSSELNHTFVNLGASPLANAYLEGSQLNQMEPFYPLHAHVCEKCFLVQLEEFVSDREIFSDYAYFSSYSRGWLEHAKRYADMAIRRFELNAESLIVELASNDGYLLQYFVDKKLPVLGIEPAANVAEVANQNGIQTLVEFFGEEVARQLVASGKSASLLIGNNVLAHVPKLLDFVKGIKILLHPRGVLTLEFPHLMRLMLENQFDTIYHEHFSYFSLATVAEVLQSAGLTIFDVEELPTHGGSLRIYGKHTEDPSRNISDNVQKLAEAEQVAGLGNLDSYLSFGERAKTSKIRILEFFVQAKNEGKRIVGYGAPAKANTLLNYCGIRSEFIEYTVDRNPDKAGKFLPGTHIPIYAPEKIAETRPDYVVILPWNLKDEIMKQMQDIRSWGGKFVVLMPAIQIFP